MKLVQNADRLRIIRQQFELWDDFFSYTDAQLWTKLAADAGSSVAASDAAGGILNLTTGATDNNEAGVFTTQEVFLFANDKPVEAEIKFAFTDLAANAGNVAFGFADAPGANLITDNGGAAAITTTGALIYKLDGGTVWRCYTKNGATTTDSTSTTTAGGGQRLNIHADAIDGTQMALTFLCDGNALRDVNGRAIKHYVPYASAGEMKLGAYAKAGAASSLVVAVDWIWAGMRR